MVPRRLFGAALVTVPFVAHGQSSDPGSQKAALIRTLRSLEREVGRNPRPQATVPARVPSSVNPIDVSARWLAAMAAKWTPAKPDEGTALLVSVNRALEAVRRPDLRQNEVWQLVAEDLSEKVEHCRAKGLAAMQRVNVITRRGGLDEIKGLEVLYIEKFLQSDPSVKPYIFRRFSSPAVEDLAPGRYVFWSKEPGEKGRSGRRKEARVGNGFPVEPIEVLAP